MKLRLEKGIIKIRLTPSEIEKFYASKYLDEKINITGHNQFCYSIKMKESIEACAVFFDENALNIHVPTEKAEKWIHSNQIGIKETIVTNKGDEIVLTLEEDLPPRKHKKK